jgi:hypothetical protein
VAVANETKPLNKALCIRTTSITIIPKEDNAMDKKIVKKSTKKSESLAQRVITLEKKVLKLEKQISHLKPKKTTPEMERMQTIVEAARKV